jgi:hypothetical protein
VGTAGAGGAGGTIAIGGSLGACTMFPPWTSTSMAGSQSEWTRDVSADAVDPDSDKYMARMNAAGRNLHPDFGPGFGIPWIAVPGTQAKVTVTFGNATESDPGPYPIPLNAPIEGGSPTSGDRHVIAVDRDNCKVYELYAAMPTATGWHASSGALFDLRSPALRKEGWTSADAAGLSVFAGLARYEEAATGEIHHALRFTTSPTQHAHVHPATHDAASSTDPTYPPLGLRVRLKASFDLTPFKGNTRVILTALKKYGMFLADNGSSWYISGDPSPMWNNTDLGQLKTVPASAFEVVKLGTIVK